MHFLSIVSSPVHVFEMVAIGSAGIRFIFLYCDILTDEVDIHTQLRQLPLYL